MSYGAARIEDVESLRTRHGYDWHSIRHHFDVRAFGVNANVAVAPGVIVEEHDETHGDGGQEELYVVVSGHATFTVDGEEVDAPAGTLVFVRNPAVKRAAVAHEAGTTLLCVGGRPGQPFRISTRSVTSSSLDLLVERSFLDSSTLAEVLAAVRASQGRPATVYGRSDSGAVDTLVRRTTRLSPSAEVEELVRRLLLSRMSAA